MFFWFPDSRDSGFWVGNVSSWGDFGQWKFVVVGNYWWSGLYDYAG